jgi:hypothetical protein
VDRRSPAGNVPHVGAHPAAGPHDARHLGGGLARVRQERDHQGHGGDIETIVAEGQRLCIADAEIGGPCARPPARESELAFRWVDRDDCARSAAGDQRFGESAVAAADIEPSQIRRSVQPVEENISRQAAPTTHQSLVGFAVAEQVARLAHGRIEGDKQGPGKTPFPGAIAQLR